MKGKRTDRDRIRFQERQRAKQREELQKVKQDIEKKGARGIRKFDAGTSESVEHAFKTQTIGLVSKDEFVEKRQTLAEELEGSAERKRKAKEQTIDNERIRQQMEAKKKKNKLSFALDDEEEGEDGEQSFVLPKNGGSLGKDPTVATEFLPDREREMEENRLREQVKKEWIQKQAEIKAEPLEITYSYWNGAGHRRQLTVKKGDSIVQEQLAPQFRELKAVSSSGLMYIKEDIIIPNSITFYELISKKALGKSGPLFQFDLQEHTATVFDPRVKSRDSHAGKVVERHWYTQNKHIFPYSNWEMFDPEKHIPK
eukprot:jgi/Picsp_1/204/NSC_00203-R1_protein